MYPGLYLVEHLVGRQHLGTAAPLQLLQACAWRHGREPLEPFPTSRAAGGRRLSRSFDAGFLTFVLPIILDTLFNQALPRVFSPMGLKMLSEHEMGFAEMAAVKRRDRALQLAVLGALAWAAVRLVKWAAAAAIGAVRRGALFG